MVCDFGRNSGRLVLSAGHLEVKKLICVNFLLKKFGGNEKSSTFAPQSTREHSSVGLEHLPYKQRVRGSTPFAPTTKTTYSNVSRLFLCCFVRCLKGTLRGVWGLRPCVVAVAECMWFTNKKAYQHHVDRLFVSGYRDSNPGLPTPEAGALTGLRYTPNSRKLRVQK